jgi:hypothetical protein
VVHQLALFSHVWHIRAAAQLIALMGATYIVSQLPSLVPPWLSMHHTEQCEEVTFLPHMLCDPTQCFPTRGAATCAGC